MSRTKEKKHGEKHAWFFKNRWQYPAGDSWNPNTRTPVQQSTRAPESLTPVLDAMAKKEGKMSQKEEDFRKKHVQFVWLLIIFGGAVLHGAADHWGTGIGLALIGASIVASIQYYGWLIYQELLNRRMDETRGE